MPILRALFGLLLILALPAKALAQDNSLSYYPSRPVRIVVGFGPGSAADLTARVLAQRLSQTMGQQFFIENKPGGGSTVAAEQVVRGPKDGTTLFVGTVANVINAVLQPDLTFDFAKDFTPIVYATSSPNILVVHPSTGVSSVKELIALAKAHPDKVFYGSSGVGTSPHLSGELFSPASTVLQYVASGQLKALASSETTRASAAPDLPTVAEAGLPGFDTSVWFGLVAPAGTPHEIIDRLAHAVDDALQNEAVISSLHAAGLDIKGGTPEAFGAFIATETKKWNEVATAAGLRK